MFANRVEKVKSEFKKAGLGAVLISSPITITYLTGFDNFPTNERDAYLLLTQDKNYILTHSIYSNFLQIDGFEVKEISRRLPPSKALLKILKAKTAKLGIEEDDLRVSEYKSLEKVFSNLKNFEIKMHRAVKTAEEIKLIEKACQIGDQSFNFILKQITEGITEKELAFKLEYFIKSKGADLAFPTIAAFGVNSFAPHHLTGDKRLEKGEFVLLDFGVKWKNYCSDMTRTIIFGKPSTKQKEIYKAVLGAQQKAVDLIEAKLKKNYAIKASEVDKVARNYIRSEGFGDIPHSSGHGVGLEVHEHPYLSKRSKEVLKEGMVFSVEPGIYLPVIGGVRIEDLFVCEKGSLRKLTKASRSIYIGLSSVQPKTA